MTTHRFHVIARATANHFWPLVFMHLDPLEVKYLNKTPVIKRRLELALVKALANVLMTDTQMARFIREYVEPLKREHAEHPDLTEPIVPDDRNAPTHAPPLS